MNAKIITGLAGLAIAGLSLTACGSSGSSGYNRMTTLDASVQQKVSVYWAHGSVTGVTCTTTGTDEALCIISFPNVSNGAQYSIHIAPDGSSWAATSDNGGTPALPSS